LPARFDEEHEARMAKSRRYGSQVASVCLWAVLGSACGDSGEARGGMDAGSDAQVPLGEAGRELDAGGELDAGQAPDKRLDAGGPRDAGRSEGDAESGGGSDLDAGPEDAAAPSDGGAEDASPAADGQVDAEVVPTFSQIYGLIISQKCAFCHHPDEDGGASAGIGFLIGHLDMSSAERAYANLVGDGGGVPAQGEDCGPDATHDAGYVRVVPGHPEESLIIDKLSHDPPECGVRMPDELAGYPALDPALIAEIAAWIRAGAPHD
jgi:hypothetical protein